MTTDPKLPQTLGERLWHALLGRARDPHDPNLVHKISLVAFLAWVGLGVDGLSSSAYGPAEAFIVLGQYGYLAFFLALATAITVLIISYTYSRMIEHFPHGGGGYIVATQLLGKTAGIVSGSALLVDYVLTITVSIVSGGDALFSLLPLSFRAFKIWTEIAAIGFLVVANLRGVKESIRIILPFFMLFVVTHLILILGGIGSHLTELPALFDQTRIGLEQGATQIGKWGLFLVFLRAYSLGGGTYTGIEAVSNGIGTLREPRVATGKRTMLYLALSLSITAGGLLLCYMLFGVKPVEGKTLNAVLIEQFAGHWRIGDFDIGYWFVLLTIFSESFLLLIAAQTGFIGGPKVMSDMAVDSWLPRRFASLSDRLTMQNGILVMGVSALGLLFYAKGNIGVLVVMYSINVFITFSMTQLAMMKHWIEVRKTETKWKQNLLVHFVGFCLCFSILWVMILEKFLEGAWATLVLTGILGAFCVIIRRHYRSIGIRIKHIENRIKEVTRSPELQDKSSLPLPKIDPTKPLAAILVGGYSKLGRRSLLAVLRFFPKTFQGVVFLSVGVINSEFFKRGEVDSLERRTEESLKGYASIANRMGLPSDYAYRLGTDVVREASELCFEISKKYPSIIFFAGELIFEQPSWWDKILHNETAYAIQRCIRHAGLPMVILPLVLHQEEKHPEHD